MADDEEREEIETTDPPDKEEGAEEAEETQEQAATPVEGEEAEEEVEEDGLEDEDREYSKRVQKRIAQKTKAQREAERRAEYWEQEAKRLQAAKRDEQPPKPSVPTTPQGAPKEADFETYEEYIKAVTRYEAQQVLAQEREARLAEERERKFYERMQEAEQRIPDFREMVYRESALGGPPITDAMFLETQKSEYAGDVAYYLATHIEEAKRIAQMPANLVAREIGKIEGKIEAGVIKTTPARTTGAPPPIPPRVGSANKGGKINPDELPIEEWMEKSRKGELRY